MIALIKEIKKQRLGNMGKAEKLYNDLLNGDPITTNDLIFLSGHLDSVSTWCFQLGPVFKLPAIEAAQRVYQIEGYLQARETSCIMNHLEN